MAYKTLYRKFRPTNFDNVVGQDEIVATLKNEIHNNQISQAYLFSGPRGTGKTSVAKIFAKEVNKVTNKDPEFEYQDIIEIDAASNNGVSEIRKLKENSTYVPVELKNKVYIIDEAHMLSKGAFNALLKTLEEPPANVIFILATTEENKIPITILSRVQKFHFSLIDNETLSNRLLDILKEENITIENEALSEIVTAAKGSLRDALSFLDQIISFTNRKNIELEETLYSLGRVGKNKINKYFEYISNNKATEAIKLVRSFLTNGISYNSFLDELLEYIEILFENGIAERKRELDLFEIINTIDNTSELMKNSLKSSLYLDMLNIRLTNLFSDNIDEKETKHTEESIETNSNKIDIKKDNKNDTPELNIPSQEIKNNSIADNFIDSLIEDENDDSNNDSFVEEVITENELNNDNVENSNNDNTNVVEEAESILDKAIKSNLEELVDIWDEEIVKQLDVSLQALLYSTTPVAASDNKFIVSFKNDSLFNQAQENKELKNKISSDVEEVLGVEYSPLFLKEDDWLEIRTNYIKKLKQNKNKKSLKKEPIIKDEKQEKQSKDAIKIAKDLFGDDMVKVK